MDNRSTRHLMAQKIQMLLMVFTLLFTSACNMPGNSGGNNGGEQQGTGDLNDPNAELYRMYFDTSGDMSQNELQVRNFMGNVQIENIEDIFGPLEDLPRDDNGNIVTKIDTEEGSFYLNIASGGFPVNLASSLPDGTQSSVFDLNGDGTADIVDIQLPDNRRITMVTEFMGLDFFQSWLRNLGEFCQNELTRQFGLANFGCNNSNNESSSGGGSDREGGVSGSRVVDPFDLICAGYPTGPRASLMKAVRPWGYVWDAYSSFTIYNDGSQREGTVVTYHNDLGEAHTETQYYDYDASGNLVQSTHESVDSNGNGTRTTKTYDGHGNVTGTTTQSISTPVDEQGRPTGPSSPPQTRPGSNQSTLVTWDDIVQDGEPVPNIDPNPGTGGSKGDPGPEGSDMRLADFCAHRGEYRSGVEENADHDPRVTSVSCNDLVGAPSMGDCVIIEWAGASDFTSILASPSAGPCGEFQQAGGNGECEPATALERLRGLTSRIASMNLPTVVFCPPIECDPVFAQSATSEGISLSDLQTPETRIGTPEPSNLGDITRDTYCYWGPGSQFEIVNSLLRGIKVQIVGIGISPGWLVIDSPVFPGIPCWVSEDDITPVPGFDPSAFPVVPIPQVQLQTPEGDQGGKKGGGGHVQGPGDCEPDEYWSIVLQSCQPFP